MTHPDINGRLLPSNGNLPNPNKKVSIEEEEKYEYTVNSENHVGKITYKAYYLTKNDITQTFHYSPALSKLITDRDSEQLKKTRLESSLWTKFFRTIYDTTVVISFFSAYLLTTALAKAYIAVSILNGLSYYLGGLSLLVGLSDLLRCTFSLYKLSIDIKEINDEKTRLTKLKDSLIKDSKGLEDKKEYYEKLIARQDTKIQEKNLDKRRHGIRIFIASVNIAIGVLIICGVIGMPYSAIIVACMAILYGCIRAFMLRIKKNNYARELLKNSKEAEETVHDIGKLYIIGCAQKILTAHDSKEDKIIAITEATKLLTFIKEAEDFLKNDSWYESLIPCSDRRTHYKEYQALVSDANNSKSTLHQAVNEAKILKAYDDYDKFQEDKSIFEQIKEAKEKILSGSSDCKNEKELVAEFNEGKKFVQESQELVAKAGDYMNTRQTKYDKALGECISRVPFAFLTIALPVLPIFNLPNFFKTDIITGIRPHFFLDIIACGFAGWWAQNRLYFVRRNWTSFLKNKLNSDEIHLTRLLDNLINRKEGENNEIFNLLIKLGHAKQYMEGFFDKIELRITDLDLNAAGGGNGDSDDDSKEGNAEELLLPGSLKNSLQDNIKLLKNSNQIKMHEKFELLVELEGLLNGKILSQEKLEKLEIFNTKLTNLKGIRPQYQGRLQELGSAPFFFRRCYKPPKPKFVEDVEYMMNFLVPTQVKL